MINERHAWPYWSVDLPGLTEANARRLLAWAAGEDVAFGGIVVDPADAFSVHMDRETVAALVTALKLALGSNELPSRHAEVVRGFAYQLADWMSNSPAAD